MKIAAYQAPIDATQSLEVVSLIQQQIAWCEENSIEILCCPEAVLGGLADYADDPSKIALDVAGGQLDRILEPLASETVKTIVGFTEICDGHLYNSAAVFYQRSVVGIYRKMHPAVNRSVYSAGDQIAVFTIGNLTFGIIICYDSNFEEPARTMAEKGARVLFIPTNNGVPNARSGSEFVEEARVADRRLAAENKVHVVRADVAGSFGGFVSQGSTEIVDPFGVVLKSSQKLIPDRLVARIE